MTDSSSAPILRIAGLTRHFGGVAAVSGIDLDVAARETVAIIGPNGAGKTTLYNMISGRLKPSAGTLTFEGQDITGLAPHRISRRGVSRSFQINNIFTEMSVRENVEVALTAYRKLGRRWFNIASRATGLQADARALLDRLSIGELAERRAGTISYGDKRLLEIAVVLATEPRLVLLDEPTAGMTPEETRRVTELVRQLAASGDYTFLITEHDMEVVFNLADRILVMNHGQTLVLGTPDEVRGHPDVRRAYLGEDDDADSDETAAEATS